MSDFMEIDNLGLIPEEEGWFLDPDTGHHIDPEGQAWDDDGNLVAEDFWANRGC